jgi:hypothetical protein
LPLRIQTGSSISVEVENDKLMFGCERSTGWRRFHTQHMGVDVN